LRLGVKFHAETGHVKPFRALLWDNDGVLVDTEGLFFQATREALARAGVTISQAQYVKHFLVSNRGLEAFAEALGGAAAIARVRVDRGTRYSELLRSERVAIPGADEVLAALAPHHRMALVTSSSPEHLLLAHARTACLRHFETIVAEGDYPRSKPNPDPYEEALRRLNLAPEECLAIEDSRRGLLAAKAAGLTCWVVPTPLSAAACLDEADAILPSLSDLPGRLGFRRPGEPMVA
jgi:HAD superfamily hydrolase (TIGR01509 family)